MVISAIAKEVQEYEFLRYKTVGLTIGSTWPSDQEGDSQVSMRRGPLCVPETCAVAQGPVLRRVHALFNALLLLSWHSQKFLNKGFFIFILQWALQII